MDNWKKAVQDKFGFDPKHLNITIGRWIIESWDKSIYPELAKNDNNLQSKLDKLHEEFVESSKQSEGPLTQELIVGKHHYIARSEGVNILTNIGMNEMGKRSTAESSSTNTHHAIGTGTTTETISDTVLETEVGRKVIGTRNVVNQTERYSTAFTSADITPPQNISEAGILTEAALGVLIMRITATPVELDTGKVITLQTNITHQNGTIV